MREGFPVEEALLMKQDDIDRLHVIRQVLDRKLSWPQAAEQLDLSGRQVGRLCAKVRRQGSRGILHGLKGRASNCRTSEELLGKALSALHDPLWEGFGPTFAKEKLEEHYGVKLGR